MDRMRCRRLKEDNNIKNVVWFGSYGLNQDGTAKFYNDDNKHDNYAENQQSVADSLTQQLSVIRQELWYDITFGLPLLEKTKSKLTMDSAVSDIILGYPDVKEILDFESTFVNSHYKAKIDILSIYGEIILNV